MTKVGIIGLGYVGESLARAISNLENIELVGMDYSGYRVRELNFDPTININASNEESILEDCDIYLVCVGTPMSTGGPNDHYVIAAAKQIERQSKPGALAIIESTVPIGFMSREFYPVMKRAGVLAAYSPERINPTDRRYGIQNTTKLLAGVTKEASDRALEFYSQFVDNVVVADNVMDVEAAKIFENAYRLINIDFVNQFEEACSKAGLNAKNIIDLAGTKEFGFHKFNPSAGAGGHCIPVDPEFMTYYFNKHKVSLDPLARAIESNQDRPRRMLSRIRQKYGDLTGYNILVVGMAYKPNTGDARNSAGNVIFQSLLSSGMNVEWHDDLVVYHESRKSVNISKRHNFIIVVVRHDDLDLSLAADNAIIVDISDGTV